MTTTGGSIDLGGVVESRAGYDTWPTKGQAVTALKTLQARGLNVIDNISIHPARSGPWRFW